MFAAASWYGNCAAGCGSVSGSCDGFSEYVL